MRLLTVADALRSCESRLGAFDTARTDAEELVSRLLGVERGQLAMLRERPLEPEQWRTLDSWLGRRARGEPVQYITGRAAFRDLDLDVGPAVLVPRPETEVLAGCSRSSWTRPAPPRSRHGSTVRTTGKAWSCATTSRASPGSCWRGARAARQSRRHNGARSSRAAERRRPCACDPLRGDRRVETKAVAISECHKQEERGFDRRAPHSFRVAHRYRDLILPQLIVRDAVGP